MPISVDDVEELRSILSALPKHQQKQLSKQEAIASLASELGAAQRRGYSSDELAQLMVEKGIDINGPTLRNCLRRLRKRRRSRDKNSAPSATSGSVAVPAESEAREKRLVGGGSGDAPKVPAAAPVREAGASRLEVGQGTHGDERVARK
jgi:hypothetical protein